MGSKKVLLDLGALAIEKMASGRLCLSLSEKVSIEGFPQYAERLLEVLGGQKEKSSGSVEMVIWRVFIGNCRFNLVWDDYPYMVSLESSNDSGENGDEVLKSVYLKLFALAADRDTESPS